MNEKVEQFFNKSEGIEFNGFEEMLKFGEENAKVYNCVARHLDENLRPEFQLLDSGQCPNEEQCGRCAKCEYMIDALSEDGTIFSHGVYKLVCVC